MHELDRPLDHVYSIQKREEAIAEFKKWRLKSKCTQKRWAEVLGVTQTDISNYETDHWDRISFKVLIRLVDSTCHMLCFIPFEEGWERCTIARQGKV